MADEKSIENEQGAAPQDAGAAGAEAPRETPAADVQGQAARPAEDRPGSEAPPTAERKADAPTPDEPPSGAEAEPSGAEAKPSRPLPPPGAGPLAARKTGGRAERAPLPKVASRPGRPAASPGQPAEGRRAEPDRPSDADRDDGAAEGAAAEAGDAGEKPPGGGKRPARGRTAVPNKRAPLSEDLQHELESALAEADVDALLGGAAGMGGRTEPLTEGQQVRATVLKVDDEHAFVALGGPDEGMVPIEQFEEGQAPAVGQPLDVMVRGFNPDEGLYVCTLPGQAIEVVDWSDLEEGTVVEAFITGSNSGGLECKVGSVRGFIPISQISEYRVEEPAEFVDQRMTCLVTEANPRRKNLVLSRRAVLEREREERRKEQLEKIEPGDILEGTVRSVKDFGAFVDLGGLDGLIHVSRLSWERVKHPSEVLEVGQKVKVKVEKVDKQTGKIGLSYRDLLEHPWDGIEAEFPVGTTVRGTVTRTAEFGAFVRVAPGVEGLVHISELAHHRVLRVANVVKEGDEVDVKVLSVDRENQKMSLSLKATQTKPQSASDKPAAESEEEPPREPAVKRRHAGPLKGGTERGSGGEQFGLRL